MRNKKGQLGATLTWFGAFFVILFIMILFLIAVFWLSEKKDFFAPNEISIAGEKVKNLDVQRRGIEFLDSSLIYEGKEISVKDLIILRTSFYTQPIAGGDSFLKKSGVSSINQINEVKDRMPELKILAGIKEDEEKEFFNSLHTSLQNDKFEYIVKTPLGYAYNVGRGAESSSQITPIVISEETKTLFGEPAEIKIPYENYVVDIEFYWGDVK